MDQFNKRFVKIDEYETKIADLRKQSAISLEYLNRLTLNIANVKKGVDGILKFRNAVPEQFRGFVDPMITGALSKVGKAKGKEIEDYISKSANNKINDFFRLYINLEENFQEKSKEIILMTLIVFQ